MQLPPNPGRNVNAPLLRVELEQQGETSGRTDWLLRHSLSVLAAAILLLFVVGAVILLLT